MKPGNRRSLPIYTVLIAIAAALLLAACGSSSSSTSSSSASAPTKGFSGEQAVSIQGFKFTPAALTVPKGTKVTWTNGDSATHNATASGAGGFQTGNLTKGQSGSATLDTPGTYNYICTIHPSMKGTITVTG